MANNEKRQDKPANGAAGGKQTDLAEGELETVEESIRIHEQKGDLPPGKKSEEEVKKKTS